MNVVVTVPLSPSEPHVLGVTGDLDVVTVPEVLDLVPTLVADARTLLVDLRSVSFLDSSGVRLLHRLARTCAEAGKGLRVVAPPGSRARQVLDIVGMTLLVEDDVDAARAALQDPPTG